MATNKDESERLVQVNEEIEEINNGTNKIESKDGLVSIDESATKLQQTIIVKDESQVNRYSPQAETDQISNDKNRLPSNNESSDETDKSAYMNSRDKHSTNHESLDKKSTHVKSTDQQSPADESKEDVKPSTSKFIDEKPPAPVLLQDLSDFETKIKEQLGCYEEFDEVFARLKKTLETNGGLENRGISILLNDFFQTIKDEQSTDQKLEIFRDMVKELKSYLADKPSLLLSDSDIERRTNSIKLVEEKIRKYDRKVKQLKLREIDLEDEEDDTFVEIGRLEAKIVRLYKKSRVLKNKYQYFGEDEIDLDDLTKYEQLNDLFAKEIIGKFQKERSLPDYNDVLELVDKFKHDNENVLVDSKVVFQKICAKLKGYRQEQLEIAFKSYVSDEPGPAESEELKLQLDGQNNFKQKINEIVSKYSDMKANTENETEEDSSDDETMTNGEDDHEILTISDSEDEFRSASNEPISTNTKKTPDNHASLFSCSDDEIEVVFDLSDDANFRIKQDVKSSDEFKEKCDTIDCETIDSPENDEKIEPNSKDETIDIKAEKSNDNQSNKENTVDSDEKSVVRSDDSKSNYTAIKSKNDQTNKLEDAKTRASSKRKSQGNKKSVSPKRKSESMTDENSKKLKTTSDDDCIILD